MAQAIVKKTISKNRLECSLPALAQSLVLEVLEPQVLVLINEEAKVESSLLKNKLLRVFNKIKYNARISEEKVYINKYKGQVDAKFLGARNSMLNF
jgi:hypothetical protein